MLATDDPLRPEIRFTIMATIRGLWLDADQIDFGIVRDKKEVRRSVRLLSAGIKGARIKGARIDGAGFTFKPLKLVENEDSGGGNFADAIELTFVPEGCPIGPSHGSLWLETNQKEIKLSRVHLTAHVEGRIEVRPNVVFLGTAACGSNLEGNCTIRINDDDVLMDNLIFNATHEYVDARIVRELSAIKTPMYRLRIYTTLPNSERAGLIKGKIEAYRDGEVIFVVPYTFVIAQSIN